MSRAEEFHTMDENWFGEGIGRTAEKIPELRENVRQINRVSAMLFAISREKDLELRRDLINRNGPFLLALVYERSGPTIEMAALVDSLAVSEGGIFEAMARMMNKLKNSSLALGFKTSTVNREEMKLAKQLREIRIYDGPVREPDKLDNDSVLTEVAERAMLQIFAEPERKMEEFERQAPLLLAIL